MSDVTPSDPNEPAPPGAAPPPPPVAPPPPGPYGGPPGSAPPPPGPYGGPPGSAPPFGPPPGGASYGFVPVPVDSQGRPLAEWWQRLVAYILDGIVLGIVNYILLAIVVGHLRSNTLTGFGLKLWIVRVIVGVISILYFALLQGSERGQSLGMMALGISVRDASTGGAITPQRAGIRMVIFYPSLVLSWVPFAGGALSLLGDIWTLICGLSPLWNDKRQGYHDISQKTTVIKVR
jgi:uncharacterized RDD family membrane protein YckC